MKYSALRGTKDILPDETPVWQHIEKTIHEAFQNYGFSEIRTPIIEQTELFVRSIGDGTDIVSKEMYDFKDKKGRNITLRPEATASVVRAVIENNLLSQNKETKLYYIGPMFRYERPQAGRQRQFYQAGLELFGSSSPTVDVEVILAAVELFNTLGLKSLEVNINSVGCGKCRPSYIEKLKDYIADNIEKLCSDCRQRFKKNPLRILDCKDDECGLIISNAPSISDFICQECKDHFDYVSKHLKSLNINVKTNNKLVRGLDYYTGTTFEIISNDLGSQNALCGGGRYDNLVEELGGGSIPAVGMAIGLERLISVMKSQNISFPAEKKVQLYIAAMGIEAVDKSIKILVDLRKNSVKAEMSHPPTGGGKSLKSQLKTADSMKAKYVLIIGDDEIKKGIYNLRNMETSEQREIDIKDLMKEIE